MHTLVWLRVPGDVLFGLGCVWLAWFALKLLGRAKGAAVAEVPAAQRAKA
jgi:nitric oxide reductase subunit B